MTVPMYPYGNRKSKTNGGEKGYMGPLLAGLVLGKFNSRPMDMCGDRVKTKFYCRYFNTVGSKEGWLCPKDPLHQYL